MTTASMQVAFAITAVLVAGACAEAGDAQDDPFSLRLGFALDRGSAFSDVVGLAASTAYPYASSPNPANGDLVRQPPNHYTFAATGTGTYVVFDSGAAITAGALSGTYRFPAYGTLVAAYTRIDSHDARTAQDDRLALSSDEFALKYSARTSERVSLGAGLRLTVAEFGTASLFDGLPLTSQTSSTGVEGTLGVLTAFGTQWLAGIFATAGWNYSDTRAVLETPPPPFGVGSVVTKLTDVTRSVGTRLGLGWRPSEALGVYADLHYIRLDADEAHADAGRGAVGVEYLPHPAIALRSGLTADTDRQVSGHLGIGLYPSRRVQFELAYVYNAFPEVRREFGRAHLLTVSLVTVF